MVEEKGEEEEECILATWLKEIVRQTRIARNYRVRWKLPSKWTRLRRARLLSQ